MRVHTNDDMKIKTKDEVVIIADDSIIADEIRKGKDFFVENGKLHTKTQSGLTSYWQILNAINDIKKVEDVKPILNSMIKLVIENQ